MKWLVGTINKHIVHDSEGAWVGTFKDDETAATMVNLHNIVDGREQLIEASMFDTLQQNIRLNHASITENGNSIIYELTKDESEAIDTKIAISAGWTNNVDLKGWGRNL
jgi:hypothetical protein